MYVDKTLVGLAAVQTLSRLNRIHPLKTDTSVLDFRNDAEEIQKAFEPYYGRTAAPPTDPNVLADSRGKLDEFDVLREAEMVLAVQVIAGIESAKDHGQVYAVLDKAIDRFNHLAENRLASKDALDKFGRTYSFVSQIVALGDTTLERDYIYCRALATCLAVSTASLDLSADVQLTHLRNEMTFEGSISLAGEEGIVKSFFGTGTGKQHEPDTKHLSEIVDVLNEKFGLELDDKDQLLFDQFEESWASDRELATQAKNNSLENFGFVFGPKFLDTIVNRMDANEAIFKKILDDPDFRQTLADYYLAKVYSRLRASTPEAASV
jgi:type I restriction enzyme R subunit